MYHLTILLVALVAGLRVSAQETATVFYSTAYDNSTLLSSLACGDAFGNYTTLGSLPNFPAVGGVDPATGGSPNGTPCGGCYNVAYGTSSFNITIVDAAGGGFVVTQQVLDALTGGQAALLGSVQVTYAAVDPSGCYPSSS